MERAGRALAGGRPSAPRGGGSPSSAGRATTAATGSSPHVASAISAATPTCCCIADPSEYRGDAPRTSTGSPGPRPWRSTQPASTAAPPSSTRSSAPASAASREIRSRRPSTPSRASAQTAVVVACDVPSGVDFSTGEVPGAAVPAAATVTFHAAGPGLWIAPGKGFAGEVSVADIGIPAGGPGDDDRRVDRPQVCAIASRGAAGTRPSSPPGTSSSAAARPGSRARHASPPRPRRGPGRAT